MPRRFITLSALLFLIALLLPLRAAQASDPVLPCRIIKEYPHDPHSSTQGLFFHNGRLYESSGGFGKSFIAIVDLETGRHIRKHTIQGRLFAEGITVHDNKLFLLTWLSGTGSVHDLDTLDTLSTFTYRRADESVEGWGLAANATRLIASSGTGKLRIYRSQQFIPAGSLTVTENDNTIRLLNELELVDSTLFANIWKHDTIAVIDITTGTTKTWIDLTPLRERLSPQSGVANGIAYDAVGKRLFVTGKHWDKLFQIEVDKKVWE